MDAEQIADRLGAGARGVGLRARVLAANGIRTRHYALDENGAVTMPNEELAAAAVQEARKERDLPLASVSRLATSSTQDHLLVPGFASIVHGRLGGPAMEVLSAGGVCASSKTALVTAARAVRLGEHRTAVVVGSELVSRSLRQSRYDGDRASFDAEFLRWTLSDGAGAVVLESQPRPDGLGLRLDWMHLVSYAGERPVCMSAGGAPVPGRTWLDGPDVASAELAGLVRLRQDVKSLPALFQLGLRESMGLVGAVHARRHRPRAVPLPSWRTCCVRRCRARRRRPGWCARPRSSRGCTRCSWRRWTRERPVDGHHGRSDRAGRPRRAADGGAGPAAVDPPLALPIAWRPARRLGWAVLLGCAHRRVDMRSTPHSREVLVTEGDRNVGVCIRTCRCSDAVT